MVKQPFVSLTMYGKSNHFGKIFMKDLNKAVSCCIFLEKQ